jgi:hypothetical protein
MLSLNLECAMWKRGSVCLNVGMEVLSVMLSYVLFGTWTLSVVFDI